MSVLRSVSEQPGSGREQREGTLIQVDVIGSTFIARKLGGERWKKYQRELVQEIGEVSARYGFSPEVLIWDAVFMTSRGRPEPGELIRFTTEVVSAVSALNDRFAVLPVTGDPARCVRVCATYGDVTRESRNGCWSITGLAMPRIAKLEQAVKEMDLVLAVSDELASRWAGTGSFTVHRLKNTAVVLGVQYEELGGAPGLAA